LECTFEQMVSLRIPFSICLDTTRDVELKKWNDHIRVKLNTSQESLQETDKLKAQWMERLPMVNEMQTLMCRFCLHSLLQRGDQTQTIQKVQRLPGDHRQEMMDSFWVCACTKPALSHSPVVPSGPIHAMKQRLLIGESYVLVHMHDIAPSALAYDANKNDAHYNHPLISERQWNEVCCGRCRMPLGFIEVGGPDRTNLKLWKHRITNSINDNVFRLRTLETLLTSQLISTMKVHQTYRFFIRDVKTHKIHIQLLVVNWEIFVSTNAPNVPSCHMRPAIKVAFNDCTQNDPNIASSTQKWEENYQLENILYTSLDTIGLLQILYQRNTCYPPSRRLWPPNMKTSFLFNLPEEVIFV